MLGNYDGELLPISIYWANVDGNLYYTLWLFHIAML